MDYHRVLNSLYVTNHRKQLLLAVLVPKDRGFQRRWLLLGWLKHTCLHLHYLFRFWGTEHHRVLTSASLPELLIAGQKLLACLPGLYLPLIDLPHMKRSLF